MILCSTPYSPDCNLGGAYNAAMELLPEDGWMAAIDHDAAWTTRVWWRQIEEAVREFPEAGLFTAMTNRIAAPWQQIGDREDHDMRNHRRFGAGRLRYRTLLDITDTNGFGGVVIVISKAAWRKMGGFVDGMLCVDHLAMFRLRDVGLRSFLIESLYVYHWRRACGDELPDNTPRAEGCPCRGTERMPKTRLALPEAVPSWSLGEFDAFARRTA